MPTRNKEEEWTGRVGHRRIILLSAEPSHKTSRTIEESDNKGVTESPKVVYSVSRVELRRAALARKMRRFTAEGNRAPRLAARADIP